ncbi:diguanylate cyclase [Kineococcus sp. R8]|uniref:GGDEF domain-containing protein n=1 Tax=Kineococcus siccus TaxID=2696567 RepID=UPI00141354E0|nr:GGDEF domain-containing protein [Kineococcus siccus]NAZ80872.1 diguanylate cyclase [Kineococcus siccus]
MGLPAALAPRDLESAARSASVFAFVGAAVLLVLPFAVPSFTPTAVSRGGALALGVGLVAVGVVELRAPAWLPALFWFSVPTQLVAATTALALTTSDASAAAQSFLLWPVLYAARELRRTACWLVLAQVLAADAVIVLALLPLDRAVTDVACVGATLAVVGAVLLRAREREDAVVAELERRAAVDSLTGLATRRVLDRAADAALAGGAPGGRAVLLLVDVDHFKRVNDAHGHPAGDEVLQHVARLLREVFPAPGLVARLGGDELAVLLSSATLEQAVRSGQELRRRLAVRPPRWAGHEVPVTVSVGVAAAAEGQGPVDLYAAADEALYRAKRAGRDGVHAQAAAGR